MLLERLEWGTGSRVAVLLDGMMGSVGQFHRVGPALADRGYRVIAGDLPGHGQSPAAPEADLALFASSVVESVGAEPELAIDHSLGAVVLAQALPRLRPSQVTYVDVPFSAPSAADRDRAQTKTDLAEELRAGL